MVSTQQILGIHFFDGAAHEAVATVCRDGGLMVAPAAPALVNIQHDAAYRNALLRSDLAIADSGFMVLLWRLLQHRSIRRISGLAYLQALVDLPQLRAPAHCFLVLPTPAARERAFSWLGAQKFAVDALDCYVAPQYESEVRDAELIRVVEQRRPAHIIIGIGGGTQEKLGLYLRETLSYRPAIHCTGAAIGFLTGDQKPIPKWADRFYLGWLLRLTRNPLRYFRRFLVAYELPGLIARYGSDLPPLKARSGKAGKV